MLSNMINQPDKIDEASLSQLRNTRICSRKCQTCLIDGWDSAVQLEDVLQLLDRHVAAHREGDVVSGKHCSLFKRNLQIFRKYTSF